MRFTSALFDLDGTLMDTLPDLANAVNAMRLELGMAALPDVLIGTYIGKGASVLVERALQDPDGDDAIAPERLRDALERFQHHYHLINGDAAVLYPGCLEGLERFRSMGLRLAVVTNKPTAFTAPLLERAGIAHFFDVVVCGDTCARAKPDPMPVLHACTQLGVSPDQAVMVGDSVNDALAGRAAGAAVLAVPYGYNEGHDVQTLDVDAIVSSIADAAQWVQARQTPDNAQAE